MSYGLSGSASADRLARTSFNVSLPVELVGQAVDAGISAAKEHIPEQAEQSANEAIVTLLKGALVAGVLVTAAFLGYKYMTRQS